MGRWLLWCRGRWLVYIACRDDCRDDVDDNGHGYEQQATESCESSNCEVVTFCELLLPPFSLNTSHMTSLTTACPFKSTSRQSLDSLVIFCHLLLRPTYHIFFHLCFSSGDPREPQQQQQVPQHDIQTRNTIRHEYTAFNTLAAV